MTEPTSTPGHPVVSPVDDTDWPQQAAGMIVDAVGQVRDKTTGPVLTAGRWVVYGTLAAFLGLLIGFLLLVAAIRATTELLQWATGEQDVVWLTYALIGIVFVGLGLALWSRRSRPG